MNLTATQQDAMAEAFEDLKNMLYTLVKRFRARYRLTGTRFEFDELMAEANYQFVEAWIRYDGEHGSIQTWVYYRVWINLFEKFRRYTRTASRTPIQTLSNKLGSCPLDTLPNKTASAIRLVELMDELTEDAATIVKLVIDKPGYVWRAENVSSNKMILRSYMRQLGWSVQRINNSFEEIASVLNAA